MADMEALDGTDFDYVVVGGKATELRPQTRLIVLRGHLGVPDRIKARLRPSRMSHSAG